MAPNLSVGAVRVTTSLHLSFPHMLLCLSGFFLNCESFQTFPPLFFLLLFYTHLSCDILVSLGTERFPWPTRTPWRACKYFHRCSFLLLQQPPSQKNPCSFLYLVYSHYIFCFFNLKSPQMNSFLLGTSLYLMHITLSAMHVCHSRPPHSSLNPCSRFILQNWNSVIIHSRCSTFHSVCMCARTEDASWAARLD